jgi:hypothetical protein
MFMNANKKTRKLRSSVRILLLLGVCACLVCFGLAGWHGWRYFHRRDNTYAQKAEHAADIRDSIAIRENGSGTVLKATPDAGQTYTDETLFLGDSNTVRFMTFLDTDGHTFTTADNTIAVVGMGVDGITSVPCEQFGFGTVSMDLAVSYLQPRRIIMTFGTNNLGAPDVTAEDFAADYARQITAVEEAYPYADIIINSIPPCGKYSHYPIITIEEIREFNEAILKMCEENEWYFLNSFEALADRFTGYAKEAYIEADGIHFNADGLAAMHRYIRTHALNTEDRRPALEPVPYLIGPVTEIYTVDPLSNQEFSEEVLNPQAQQAEETPAEQYVPQEQPPAEEPAAEEPAAEPAAPETPEEPQNP